MSKFPKSLLVAAALFASLPAVAQGVPEAGQKVFRKCSACHTVGDKAANKIGPNLNDLFGRKAGGLDGFRYSRQMVAAGEGGLVWDAATLASFLSNPRAVVAGTRMTFAGLKKADERADVIAYLQQFSQTSAPPKAAGGETSDTAPAKVATADQAPRAADRPVPAHGVLHLGRAATDEEIAAWDIDVRADGKGLPPGRGSVAEGEEIFTERCAVCHGDFGEGVDRWPVLAGGFDTLTKERPEKTIGSYWPYLSTVYDYVRRAMPFGNARSLDDDEVYALTAYLLYLNDIVTDEDFVLSKENFEETRLPNEANFIPDDRASEPQYAGKAEPCMKDCRQGKATVTMRARVLDVTPDAEDDDNAGAGSVD